MIKILANVRGVFLAISYKMDNVSILPSLTNIAHDMKVHIVLNVEMDSLSLTLRVCPSIDIVINSIIRIIYVSNVLMVYHPKDTNVSDRQRMSVCLYLF